MISEIQIQLSVIFGTAKFLNTYLKANSSSHTTQILNFKY